MVIHSTYPQGLAGQCYRADNRRVNLHPHGSRRFLVALLLALMTALSSCSVLPAKPDLPADQFPAVPGRERYIFSQASAIASDGADVVAVGTMTGRVTVPGFWYSADSGSSWQLASLSQAAEELSKASDSIWGPVAVTGAGEQRNWLALGRDQDNLLAWTSADGKVWDRHAATGMDPRRDSVAEIIGMNGRFLAVGHRGDSASGTNTAAVWQSADGITWTEQLIPGLHSSGLSAVAANGQTVVAVGWDQLPAYVVNGRLQSPIMTVSNDGGQNWDQVFFAEPMDSAQFVTFLSDVSFTPNGFLAGGRYYNSAGSYRSWLLRSADGLAWDAGPAAPITGTGDGVGEILVTNESITLMQVSRTGANRQSLLFSTLTEGGSFGEVTRLPGLPTDSYYWSAAATASGAALLVSIGSTDERWTGQLWASGETGVWGKLGLPVPETMRPVVSPRQLFVHDGVLSVWGYAQGALARWEQDNDGAFTEVNIVRDEREESFGAVYAGGGGLLIIGAGKLEAQTLASSDTQNWHVSGPGTFNEINNHSHSYLSGAVWADDRWVVVGSRSTNGSVRQHALISTSTDGVTWVPGSSASIYQTGDWYSPTDNATDLDGLENMGREASAVAVVPNGLMAVGKTIGEATTEPVTWYSADKQTWQMQPLARAGLARAGAYSIEVQGERVVIYGAGWDEDLGDWRPVVWASSDGGASFTQGGIGDVLQNGGVAFSSSKFGFTAVVTADDRASAALWRSQDGLNWTSEPIEFPESGRPYQIAVNSTLERDGKLLILAELSNRTDASTVLLEVPLS